MSRGKYLSLEEARKTNKLNRFVKEHDSKGERNLFDKLLSLMTKADSKNSKADGKT